MVGVIEHVELQTKDAKQAIAFYSSLFDWRFDRVSEHYVIYGPDDQSICRFGLLEVEHLIPAKYANISITIDAIDEVLQQAVNLGAEIVDQKTLIPNYGYYANILDLDKNPVGIFERLK